MLGTLQGNARIIVLTEAISAIPFQWQQLYLPLYMLALGVEEIEVGFLASVLFAMRFIGTLLGGYAADRFGRKPILFADKAGIEKVGAQAVHAIELPEIDPFVAPILYTIPAQLLAYHVAVIKGTDVDQPRNLAKSVTVE